MTKLINVKLIHIQQNTYCNRVDIMACRVDGVPVASHDIMRSMMLLHALSEALALSEAFPQFLSLQTFLEGTEKS